MNHLLTLFDLSKKEILDVINSSNKLKNNPKKNNKLNNKTLGLLFSKPSTRTRLSFEVAISQLGGNSVFLNSSDLQLSRGETIEDTAKTLSVYLDVLAARVYNHDDLVKIANISTIPIINALSDTNHPCQALSDLQTIQETKGKLSGLKIAWVGDVNNVCRDLMIGAVKVGMDFSIACPKKYQPSKASMSPIYDLSSGNSITISENPISVINNADVVVTDRFISMGSEKIAKSKLSEFLPKYTITKSLLSNAKNDVIFMHCLPSNRGEEVTSEVLDSSCSVVWKQVENKLFTHKALLLKLLG